VIPQEAIDRAVEAAEDALTKIPASTSVGRWAVEAALPIIEAAIREQVKGVDGFSSYEEYLRKYYGDRWIYNAAVHYARRLPAEHREELVKELRRIQPKETP